MTPRRKLIIPAVLAVATIGAPLACGSRDAERKQAIDASVTDGTTDAGVAADAALADARPDGMPMHDAMPHPDAPPPVDASPSVDASIDAPPDAPA